VRCMQHDDAKRGPVRCTSYCTKRERNTSPVNSTFSASLETSFLQEKLVHNFFEKMNISN
jgi:hypothetical protein